MRGRNPKRREWCARSCVYARGRRRAEVLRPWFERRFSFEHLGEPDFPFLLERLRGAPARVEDKTRRARRASVLTRTAGRRLVDPGARRPPRRPGRAARRARSTTTARARPCCARPTCRTAGPTRRATTSGRSPSSTRPSAPCARALRGAARGAGSRARPGSAIHPRLQQPMRLVDMLYFTAEHDDHHLAQMTELARRG